MNLATWAFAASLAAFFFCGLSGFWRVTSVESFFHVIGVRRGVVALVVACTTLGTGLAYLFTAGAKNGLLALVIPLGVLVGYALLARFMAALPAPFVSSGGNLLILFRNEIERVNNNTPRHRSAFDIAVVLPLIAVFLMLFVYEIFVSSQIIAAFAAPPSHLITPPVIAAFIFLTALAYCVLGGMQAVYRAGILQLVGVVCFVSLITYAGVAVFSGISVHSAHLPAIHITQQNGVNCLLGFIDAVATQFYSLINVFAALI
jgi:hypothetical protein